MPAHLPRMKKVRALGAPLPGLTRKSPDRKSYPPGQHGPTAAGRRKTSNYRKLLEEKQKVRFNYGISESQLRRYFARAVRSSEPTGAALLSLLERRLDSIVFRLGFAPTIPAARQLITHGHILVDGRKVDRPSCLLTIGQRIEPTRKGRTIPTVAEGLERGPQLTLPGFLLLDRKAGVGRVQSFPQRSDASVVVREAAIVELYAR